MSGAPLERLDMVRAVTGQGQIRKAFQTPLQTGFCPERIGRPLQGVK